MTLGRTTSRYYIKPYSGDLCENIYETRDSIEEICENLFCASIFN
jgi:hypothetical protein